MILLTIIRFLENIYKMYKGLKTLFIILNIYTQI